MGVDIHEYKRFHDKPDYNPAGTFRAGSPAILKARWQAYAKARKRAKAKSQRYEELIGYGKS